MFDFFVTFMGVFFSGQATAMLFQFSTSKLSNSIDEGNTYRI